MTISTKPEALRCRVDAAGTMRAVVAPLLLAMLAACNRHTAPAADRTLDHDDAAKPRAAALTTAVAPISPASARTVGIVVAKAGPADIHETLPLYGVVKPNAEQLREVIARFPGTVKTVRKAIGDPVKAGETLATIESNESLQTYALTAPIAGVVTAREADPGEQAGSEVLFTIGDASSVWIELSLFPADAARVHRGQNVTITSVGGDLNAEGRIGLIGVFGSGANPALTARVVLPNTERRWTPGLFVTGAVELSTTRATVAVAAAALQMVDGRSVVFVPVEGGFAARPVRTGRADNAFVEVLEGLSAGEGYVAANSFVVKADLGKSSLEEDDDAPGHTNAMPDAPAAASASVHTIREGDDDDAAPTTAVKADSKPGSPK